MAEHKIWCWEAAYDRHGPDWHLYVVVAPASEGELERIATEANLNGFTLCGVEGAYHQGQCHTHTFIDATSAPAYLSNLRGDTQSNLWVYNMVQIHRDALVIECGYGGRGATYNEAETTFLLAVFATPGITVLRWSVLAGGEGYDYRTLAEGVGAATFHAYIGMAEGRVM